MLNRQELKELQSHRSSPSVSIYAQTHRHHPDNQQDAVRVRNLVRKARERLERESDDHAAGREVADVLDSLVETIDHEHALDTVVIFASREIAEVHYLPFRLPDEVVIDSNFATRNLVYALNRTPRYRVLLLSEKPTRVLAGQGDALEERIDRRFPVTNEGPDGSGAVKGTPHGVSSVRDERHREFFREVARRFSEVHAAEPLPIVLAGITRYQSFFREVARDLQPHVIGTLDGSFDKTPVHEVAERSWPRVLEWVEAQKQRRLEELAQAVGSGRSASGLEPVWRAAHEGRGAVLLVETDYRERATRTEDGQGIRVGGSESGGAVMDDAVDEIVEVVLARGGEVAFVPAGSLDEHQRIALILRY
jgi:hypothetical protein